MKVLITLLQFCRKRIKVIEGLILVENVDNVKDKYSNILIADKSTNLMIELILGCLPLT